jgi:stress-induced morphogen
METRESRMRKLLEAALSPCEIAITDQSGRHARHVAKMGIEAEGETHYRLKIVSPAFAGLSRVERARRVHEVLAPEFATGLHALALDLKTPEEAGQG